MGIPMGDLKCEFLRRFGITARQFNAIRVGLEGKIASIRERRPELIAEAESRIQRAERVIRILEAREPGSEKLHQKKRRLGSLRARLAARIADRDSGRVRLCFGSRRLFHKQFALEENGYTSHAEWKEEWRAARSGQFFVIGSKDEASGNQSCRAAVEDDGSVTLRLRLPDALASDSKLLVIPGVRFAYRHEEILRAHAAHARSGGLREPPAPLFPETRALGANWALPAESRHANRRQYCSADVVDDPSLVEEWLSIVLGTADARPHPASSGAGNPQVLPARRRRQPGGLN